jgi:hypothetical protein
MAECGTHSQMVKRSLWGDDESLATGSGNFEQNHRISPTTKLLEKITFHDSIGHDCQRCIQCLTKNLANYERDMRTRAQTSGLLALRCGFNPVSPCTLIN